MKHSNCSSRLIMPVVLGLAVGLGTLRVQADLTIDTFDDAATVDVWTATWGTAPELAWDAQDAGGSATSGSLRVSADYFTPDDNGWEQMVITRNFDAPVAGSLHVSVSVDVQVDPGSVAALDGTYGYFEFKRTDGSAIGGVNLASTNWTTLTFPLAATEGELTGIIVQNGNGGFQGPIILHLDNFKFNSPPAPKTVIDTFDDAATVDVWTATWGTAPELVWDAQDAGSSATSGSLRVSADYFTPEDNGWEQMVITRNFDTPVDGSQHVSVSVDVKVDPGSVASLDGNYGYFELKRLDGSAIGGVNLTSTNWTTITFPLAATEGELAGIIIQNGNGGFQGPIIYYLDNFVFTQVSGGGPPPPTLGIENNTVPGLKLYTSAPNENFQRQNIVYAPSEDPANQLWWVNQAEPMTYSVTWADFPDKNTYAGFQGHIMLIPDSGMATGNPFPDYSDPNVIMIEFQYVNTAGPDGTNGTPDDEVLARARFLHKVNEANGNAMLYRGPNTEGLPVGILGELLAPSMLGTWSVTFRNNTDITLTASDNSTLNLSMPEEDVPYFEPAGTGVSAQFGVMPNGGMPSAVGQSAIISGVMITKGSTVVVDENFQAATLDPERWIARARSNEGIFPIPPGVACLIDWGLPDAGFTLKGSTAAGGPWAPFGTPFQAGARRFVLAERAALPGPNAGFFVLTNP